MDELMKDTELNPQLIKLRNSTLEMLPAGIKRPNYDRVELTAGIIHVGLGNFHRAHQAWYLHRLMNRGLAYDWAIIGAGVRAGDADMRARLLAQDCLTTLIELDPSSISAEVIGSMIDYLPVTDDNAPLIAEMSKSSTRIVSLTVTESGYYTSTSTGQLDLDEQDIKHDALNPAQPRTVFGAIVAAMAARRDQGIGAFTVMSCDNLRGNGDITREAVVTLAGLSDPALAQWIDENATFPNAMVDCIVPATGEHELSFVQEIGIEDKAPVTHENFRQWVIEDKFCAGRPPLEKVGVTFTDDVHAYESMKIRILNAGHQVLANLGELLGLETIADCMADPLVRAFFLKVEQEEILPFVDAVPNISPSEYLSLIEKRFANPTIVDTTRRVAFDGSSRHPGFVLPILRDAITAGASIEGLAMVEALWAHMCEGQRVDGSAIEANDPHWESLAKVASEAKSDPEIWLEQHWIYAELSQDSRFKGIFSEKMRDISLNGVEAAVKSYLAL